MTAHSRPQRIPEAPPEHAREPWGHLGRYVRDAIGRIVLRARSPADTRRVVACVNAFAGVPTEMIEHWSIRIAGADSDEDLDAIPSGAVGAIRELIGFENRPAERPEDTPGLPPESTPPTERVDER